MMPYCPEYCPEKRQLLKTTDVGNEVVIRGIWWTLGYILVPYCPEYCPEKRQLLKATDVGNEVIRGIWWTLGYILVPYCPEYCPEKISFICVNWIFVQFLHVSLD